MLWKKGLSQDRKRKVIEMRSSLIGVGAALLLVAVCASPAFAAADLHDPTRSFEGLLDLIRQSSGAWNARLRGYAEALFWSLATISMVLHFFPLMFKQPDFGGLFAEAIKFIGVTGAFYMLLISSVPIAEGIISSFRQAGAAAAGVGVQLHPGEMFGVGVELAKTVTDVQMFNPVTAGTVTFSAIIILMCFAFIAAFMQLTLIESYVVINASVLLLGMGGSPLTREYAIAQLKYALAVGVKLFILTLFVGLVMEAARSWQIAYRHDETSLLTLAGLAFVGAYLSKTITEKMDALILGVSTGGGSVLGGMAAAGVAGALMAKAQLPALSSIGGVGQAIKDSISSFRGGGGGGSASMMNSGGGGGGSGGPSSKVGGGGFSARPSPPPTSGSSGQGPGASSTSGTSSPSQGARGMVRSAAAAVIQGTGAVADLVVPGMEGVASTLSPNPQPPVDGGAGPVPETPENIIRAADEPPIDTISSLQDALNNRGKA